jgi:hypothetical protein
MDQGFLWINYPPGENKKSKKKIPNWYVLCKSINIKLPVTHDTIILKIIWKLPNFWDQKSHCLFITQKNFGFQ